jgi:manganese/zinc/iron transport system permease protein
MLSYNTLVALGGAALLGLLCGVVGSFAVLRRRALLGDVLAHAALPGLAMAFLIAQNRTLPVLLAGALASGLFGLACLSFLRRRTRTKDDAAMALVLAVLFGAGIALSRHVQNVSVDARHAGLDSFIFGKASGMILSDLYLTIVVCSVAIVLVALLFKEFRLVCFDPDFGQALGYRVAWLDFAVLGLLALTVVVGLPMVGVILVSALTIIPPVAARLWTHSLPTMLLLAGLFGIISAAAGVMLSASGEGMPTGPVIVLTAAAIFILSALFAPARGLLATYLRLRRLRLEQGVSSLMKAWQGPATRDEALRHLERLGIHRSTLRFALRKGYLTSQGDRLHVAKEEATW